MHKERVSRFDRAIGSWAFALLVLLWSLAGASARLDAHQTLNAGGDEYVPLDPETGEEEFRADTDFDSPDLPYGYVGGSTASFADPVDATIDDGLYQDYRTGASFSYQWETILGPYAVDKYEVRMHFAEPSATAEGERLFDIGAEGFVRLADFDVFEHSGGTRTALVEEMVVTVVDGRLNVDFTGVAGDAIIAAIEVEQLDEPEQDIGYHPIAVDFGSVALGDSLDKVITLVNAGGETLTVSSLTSSNGTFAVTGPATPFTIDPESTRNVVVRFTPAAEQGEVGELEIASDDPDQPIEVVPVSGEGIDAPVGLERRLNSGGLDYTDTNGKLFAADKAYVSGDYGYSGGSAQTFTAPVGNTSDDALYQTVRGGNFSYLFDGLASGDYTVTLYFQEPFNNAPNKRKFDVKVEGVVRLDDYDIFAQAGGKNLAKIETLSATVGDGQLKVEFVPVLGPNAIVGAIAVTGSVPGPVEPDIAVAPASVGFGEVVIGNDADEMVTVSNTGTATLTVSGLATSNGVFSVVGPAVPFDVAPGGSEDVTVRFTPDAVGAETGDLVITSNDPDEGFVTVALSGTGDDGLGPAYTQRVNCGGGSYTAGNGDMFAADQAYSAGSWGYTGGAAVTFTTPVANTTDDPLYQAVRGAPSFSYTFDLIPNGPYEVTLYFQEPFNNAPNKRKMDVTVEGALVLDDYDIYAQAPGKNVAKNETVLANVNDNRLDISLTTVLGGNAIVSAIAVVGGTPSTVPDIAASPASVNYGTVLVGGSSDRTVTVSNTGGVPLNVTSLTTTDAVFSVIGPATPFAVAANGGSQAVTVRFSPTALGLVTGDLEIVSDDPDEALVTVGLSGEGVDTIPTVDLHINAGGGDYTDALGKLFVADKAYMAGDFGYSGGATASYATAVTGTEDDSLYQTQRQGASFSYTFDAIPAGDYEVSLYFTEPTATVDGVRKFDVTVEGALQLDDYDVFLYSGSPNPKALVGIGMFRAYRQPISVSVLDGQLNIAFSVVAGGDAIVSAISVVEKPAEPAAGFTEVADAVGMTFNNDRDPGECAPPIGTGSAWADYDNDGDVDMYFTNHGGANRLYRNDGDTTFDGLPDFTDVAAAAGVTLSSEISFSCVFIDYDNDGDEDLYVTNWGGNTLFQNRLIETGFATFLDVTAGAGVADAGRGITTAWADYDGDSDLDFYVTKHFTCMPDILESDDHLYRNNGDGTFSDVTGYLCPGGTAPCAKTQGLGFAVGWLDYDNDADLDLYLVNDNISAGFYPSVLWRNDGTDGMGGWTFSDVSVATGAGMSVNGMGLGIGDYDNDGWLDLAFSNVSPNNLMHARGDGTFEEVSALAGIQRAYVDTNDAEGNEQWTWGTTFLDYDADGWLDVLYCAGYLADDRPQMPMAFFRNNRNLTFTDVGASSGLGLAGRVRNASVADFDADGYPDLFLANHPDTDSGPYDTDGEPWLFHNRSVELGNPNHWLTVTVEGTTSNRNGIGTRLTLSTPDGVTQMREIISGATHGGGDHKAGYFGLGENTEGDLSVRWPDGTVESLGTVSADQALHLVEP